MKRIAIFALLVSLIAVLSGCGPSAEQILKDASRASQDIRTAHFAVEIKTKLPRAPVIEGKIAKQVLVQKSEGDYDFRTGDFKVKADVLGLNLTMMQVEQKQFWMVGGIWYIAPETLQMTPPVTTTLSVSQYVKYFKEVKKLGGAKIDKEACHHIYGVPNMKELVKQPGITDLMKDPTGKQIRTIDDLERTEVIFEYYVRKKDMFIKRTCMKAKAPASVDLIQRGYAEPGDKTEEEITLTFSDFNKRLNLKVPQNAKPWPFGTPG